ncbi:MAG: L,D-transpeptidase family protein [bacterium]
MSSALALMRWTYGIRSAGMMPGWAPVVLWVVLAMGLAVGTGEAYGQADRVRDAIRARCESLIETGSLQVRGAEIASVVAIPGFYRKRGYRPAWTDPENISGLMRAAEGMYEDGLNPEDYLYAEIKRVNAEMAGTANPGPELAADREMLLMDSLFRMAYHVEFGKVDPERLDPNWNIHREFRSEGLAEQMENVLGSAGIEEYIEKAKPQHQLYSCLKATLQKYRRIQAEGGWEPVPADGVLKKGMTRDNVVALRERLRVAGDLPGEASAASGDFDEQLEDAVRRFQVRHGLAGDGVVGKATFEALNVPVEDRINQLRANLERARWVLQDFTDTFVMVNIAGFRVNYVEDNRIRWSTRAQVGQPYRQTPVFRADMKYIVFNPTWTVPPTILEKDVLPAIQKDIGYLEKKNMVVLDRSGKAVDPGSVAWSKYRGPDLPYTIRQEPGPGNALGRVKFIFPNKHFIFLHDTPSKSLFDRAERAFSSGCIRVQHPFELAEILLADRGYDQARIAEVLDTGKEENVYLTKPVPTLLLYWTAFTTLDGGCNFRKDVYERDPAIIAALDGPIVLRKGHEADRDRLIEDLRNNR